MQKPKSKITPGQVIPFVLAAVVFGILLLAQAGIINLPKINVGGNHEVTTTTYKYLIDIPDVPLPDADEGEGYEVQLTVKYEGELNADPTGYRYYHDTDFEPMPPGLSVSSDGTISGVPTKAGTYSFSVCAEKGDDGVCKGFSLIVHPKPEPTTTTVPSGPHICPITSCDTGNCCGDVANGVRVSGVITWLDCLCPRDTTKRGEDYTAAGGPYNICVCLNSQE